MSRDDTNVGVSSSNMEDRTGKYSYNSWRPKIEIKKIRYLRLCGCLLPKRPNKARSHLIIKSSEHVGEQDKRSSKFRIILYNKTKTKTTMIYISIK